MIHIQDHLGDPLKHAWKKSIAVGAAHELLRADLQEQLRFLQKEIGYKHIRFHASFHDDVGVVHRDSEGRLYYNWAQLDKIYDFLVELNFAPIVEINPMPAALASGDKTFFWYKMNITPPRDYREWEEFIAAATKHFTERYGVARVREWMFEVWNEPNLKDNFWSGDFEEYCKLYESSARAVKSVCPDYRIGGPAGAGPGWNMDFLRTMKSREVPVDFLSWHGYPAGEICEYKQGVGSPHKPGQFFQNIFRKAKQDLVDDGFGELPVIITEWNTLTGDEEKRPKWVGSNDVTRLYSGAAACHYATAVDPYVDAFTFWTASDVFFEAGPHLQELGQHNQYYGMLTINGLPKPAFHAFRYLNRLQGPRLNMELDTPLPAQAGLAATREPDALHILLWNFHDPYVDSETWADTLRLPDFAADPDGQSHVAMARIRAGQGSIYEAWQTFGEPRSLTRLEEEALFAAAQPIYEVKSGVPLADGLTFKLERDEMLYIEIRPAQKGAVSVASGEALEKLNQALGEIEV